MMKKVNADAVLGRDVVFVCFIVVVIAASAGEYHELFTQPDLSVDNCEQHINISGVSYTLQTIIKPNST